MRAKLSLEICYLLGATCWHANSHLHTHLPDETVRLKHGGKSTESGSGSDEELKRTRTLARSSYSEPLSFQAFVTSEFLPLSLSLLKVLDPKDNSTHRFNWEIRILRM